MAYWVGWNRLIERRHCQQLAGYSDFKQAAQLNRTGAAAAAGPGHGRSCYLQEVHPTFAAHVVQLESPDLLLQLPSLLQLPHSMVARARDAAAASQHLLPRASSGGWKSNASKTMYGRVSWADMWDAAPALAQQAWTMAQR